MQFSLFGAESALPDRADLDGLLLAGAQWVRDAGRARLSVLVEPGWREEALRAELEARALPGEVADAEGGQRVVRTEFRDDLLPAAKRWTRGAGLAAPTDLTLSSGGLRLWALASGAPDKHGGYLLGTRDPDTPLHRRAGAQLASLGIAAISITRPRPGWRVVGQRRVRRLAELVGDRPAGAGLTWPF
ncbi:MAG: hypothetical protein ACR2KJ_02740 [Jatrophihabitans sp.]